ncbi:MAG TPA: type VI secretion system baseplate subunit TssF [Verrucomicrobiales bacterium]|nr:type VI secretion system baseplate subunit TssF [Verrucomicrobiales bacterium]
MNRAFLQIYNEELRHIREVAGDFAAAYPKIAARLSLGRESREACADPFVERLLEGFAYLTSRVQLKLEAEFPRFTQGLLETVYPDYLAPGPSAAIVRMEPNWSDKSLLDGIKVPRGSSMQSLKLKDEATTCRFVTAHEVTMYPLEVAQADYLTRNMGELALPAREFGGARAALRIRLRLKTAGPEGVLTKLLCDKLSFFLHGEDHLPAVVMEEIFARGMGVVIREPSDHLHRRSEFLKMTTVRHVGFEEDEAMLPPSPRSFEGYRILREHFLLPARGLFVEFSGLRNALQRFAGKEFDIIVPLRERKEEIADFVQPSLFQLFCTPVINLFKRRSERAPITPSMNEYQLIIDRTRIFDYEIYSVEKVTGFGRTSSEEQPFYPFYLHRHHRGAAAAFYTCNRVPRALSESERKFGQRSTYPGSEVFISLVDPESAPFSPSLEQLSAECWVTNRHLAVDLAIGVGNTDFTAESHMQVVSIRCLVRPTPPRPAVAEGRFAWRAINHLSLNYLSLISHGEGGAEALRELLHLYAVDPKTQSHIDGIRRVASRPGLARSPGIGPVSFIRGIDVDLTLDEDRFAGFGTFLFASAIEQFLARYVSLNCFTRLTLFTEQRGEVMKWPIRTGRIPSL